MFFDRLCTDTFKRGDVKLLFGKHGLIVQGFPAEIHSRKKHEIFLLKNFSVRRQTLLPSLFSRMYFCGAIPCYTAGMIPSRLSRLGFLFVVCCVLALAYILVRTPLQELSRVKVSFLDVGQGDSILIQGANGTQMLIDGGRGDSALQALARILPPGDRFIDVVIATHPDADHIGGLPLIMSRYGVGLFLTSDVDADTDIFQELRDTIDRKRIPAYFVRSGMKLSFEDVLGTEFTILFPDRDTTGWETNNASVVGRLQVGSRSALLTGDAPVWVEQYLTALDPKSIDVDILKLGHHGSRTSTSASLLKAGTPSLAIISAGRDNSYGHPHKEVLDLLTQFGVPTASTAQEGTITLETDGTKWWRTHK